MILLSLRILYFFKIYGWRRSSFIFESHLLLLLIDFIEFYVRLACLKECLLTLWVHYHWHFPWTLKRPTYCIACSSFWTNIKLNFLFDVWVIHGRVFFYNHCELFPIFACFLLILYRIILCVFGRGWIVGVNLFIYNVNGIILVVINRLVMFVSHL